MLALAERISPTDLVRALKAHEYHYANERDLQDAIAVILRRREIPFSREVRLTATDRIDFLVGLGIGVEVKLDGQMTELLRQLARYAQCEDVSALVVVTPKSRLAQLPDSLNGKPIYVVHLQTF